MAKSNFGYIGAGGLAGLSKGVEQLIAERFEAQQLAKEEALAREKLWQSNLVNQRNFMLDQEQLGVSKGTLKLAQERAAREAAEAARPAGPKPRVVSGITRPGKTGKYTVIVDDNNPSGLPLSEFQEYEAPAKPNTTPVRGIKGPDGKPMIRFYDESGQPVGADVPEYEDPQRGGPSTPKPATGRQDTALGFYNRMNSALSTIDRTEAQLSDHDRGIISGVSPNGWGELLTYPTLSDAGKSYVRAMKQFIQAKLRRESGAAISAGEYISDLRQLAAQVGDTPDTTAERIAARRDIAEGMAFEAGPAYEQFYGAPFKRGQPADAPGGGAGRAPGAGPGQEAAYQGTTRRTSDGRVIGKVGETVVELERRNGLWYPKR